MKTIYHGANIKEIHWRCEGCKHEGRTEKDIVDAFAQHDLDSPKCNHNALRISQVYEKTKKKTA